MVFIHGGGFYSGAGKTDAYGPERILDYGIVRKILFDSFVKAQTNTDTQILRKLKLKLS